MDQRQLVKAIIEAGGTLEKKKGSNHYEIYFKGRKVSTMSSTPGSFNKSLDNTLAQCRRAGMKIPRK